MLPDLRHAFRSLLRSPGFSAAAIVTLALGIGANASVFSVVNAVLLRPLPYTDPSRVVMVWNHWTGWPRTWLSEPEAQDYGTQSDLFEHFAPFAATAVNLTGDGAPERVTVGLLSLNVLPVLGVTPALGRSFSAEEDRPGGPAAALITDALWRRRLGHAPDVIGRTLIVNGVGRTIIGVLPAGFRMPLDFAGNGADVYLPLALGPARPNERGSHYLNAVARVRTGLTLFQAQAGLDAFVERMKRETNAYDDSFGSTLVPVTDQVFGPVRPALGLITGAVAFVLLLACVNVASLLLMRAEGRQREIAVRRALGAGLWDLARTGLSESLLLSSGGAVIGLGLAMWVVGLLPRLAPASLPRVGNVSIDGRVLGFTALACLMTTVLCGVLPVWRAARRDPKPALGEGARGTAGRGFAHFRRSVIATELGVAVLLCVGAGLLLRSFVRLTSVPLGFAPGGVLTFRLSVPSASYPTTVAGRRFVAAVLDRMRGVPGVAAAGATSDLPLSDAPGDWGFLIEGRPLPVGHEPVPTADWMVATPGYAEAMGLRLAAGRWFDAGDAQGASGVVAINQATSDKYWHGAKPIGARFRLGGMADSLPRTVIGVVADVHQNSLDAEPRPQMYLPHAQFPATVPDSVDGAIRSMTVTLRSVRRPADLIGEVRQAVHELDPNMPLAQVRTLDDVVRASTATSRFALAMVGAFALLALAIAGVGVYGVIAYVVALRTREIGVRVALGAQRRDVLRLVVSQGMAPAAAGIILGLATAFAARGLVGTLLYQVPPTDGPAFLGAAALLASVGLLACYLPARRAARVNPLVALRSE